jgi:alkylation response protein AidB-like acyl-CoA dehydrogenase
VSVSDGDLERFRQHVRLWLEENCPASMRVPFTCPEDEVWGGRNAVFLHPDSRLWLERMAAKGWTAPTWPKEYGGGGLSADEAKVLEDEQRRLGCRPALKSFGLWMLGPVLLQYGTEAQKREHLPKIARGEIRWAQGYSEPSAGSDLASLRTAAIQDGDAFVVTGQKTWTSHADKADWIFCLVRTDPAAPKHEGISFLLIDMRSPGVSTRPIQLFSGFSPFCETFFDGVRVPVTNLVGKAGGGWAVAKALLEHERALISKVRDAAPGTEESLESAARRYGALDDASLRDRITQANLDFLCNKLTLERSNEAMKAGRGPGPETSMFKLYGTELNKRRKELFVLIAGYQGIGWDGPGFTPDEIGRTRDWLRSRANSIEGGSSEIQLNIIAKRVLGLPD